MFKTSLYFLSYLNSIKRRWKLGLENYHKYSLNLFLNNSANNITNVVQEFVIHLFISRATKYFTLVSLTNS